MKVPQCSPYTNFKLRSDAIRRAVNQVLDSGWYILGSCCEAFEKEFALYSSTGWAVGVASGTDAVELALRALELPEKAKVALPTHTASATGVAVLRAGLTPVLINSDPDTFTISLPHLRQVLEKEPDIAAVVPVHLYGCLCPMEEIMELAREYGLKVVEDCAQAHGAMLKYRKAGTFGDLGAFSFYPTKNLGAAGDGGAVITGNRQLRDRLLSLRQYGWEKRFVCSQFGVNSRLDEMQSAILREKLPFLDRDNAARNRIARLYRKGLADLPVKLPVIPENTYHVYHQFVIRTSRRDELQKFLLAGGVGCAVHYPAMLHQQELFAPFARPELQGFDDILSLPMFPELSEEEVNFTIAKIRAFFQ